MVLLAICVVGVLTFLLLRPTPWAASSDVAATSSPFQVLKASFNLMITPGMLLAMVTFAYTGLALTFWSGLYGTCIGRSDFSDAKSLVGLHGIGKRNELPKYILLKNKIFTNFFNTKIDYIF